MLLYPEGNPRIPMTRGEGLLAVDPVGLRAFPGARGRRKLQALVYDILLSRRKVPESNARSVVSAL